MATCCNGIILDGGAYIKTLQYDVRLQVHVSKFRLKTLSGANSAKHTGTHMISYDNNHIVNQNAMLWIHLFITSLLHTLNTISGIVS